MIRYIINGPHLQTKVEIGLVKVNQVPLLVQQFYGYSGYVHRAIIFSLFVYKIRVVIKGCAEQIAAYLYYS